MGHEGSESHFDRRCWDRAVRAELADLAELCAVVICDAQDLIDATPPIRSMDQHHDWQRAIDRRDEASEVLVDIVDPLAADSRPLTPEDLRELRGARRRLELELERESSDG